MNINLKEIINRKLIDTKYQYALEKEMKLKDNAYYSLGSIIAYEDLYNDLNMNEKEFVEKYDAILAVRDTDYYYITKDKWYRMTILDGYANVIGDIIELICPSIFYFRPRASIKYNLLLPEHDIYDLGLKEKNINKRSEGYFSIEHGFIEFDEKTKKIYDKAFENFIDNVYIRLLKKIAPEDIDLEESSEKE